MLFESLLPGIIGGAVTGGTTGGGFLSGLKNFLGGVGGARRGLGNLQQFAGMFGGGQPQQQMYQGGQIMPAQMIQNQQPNLIGSVPLPSGQVPNVDPRRRMMMGGYR